MNLFSEWAAGDDDWSQAISQIFMIRTPHLLPLQHTRLMLNPPAAQGTTAFPLTRIYVSQMDFLYFYTCCALKLGMPQRAELKDGLATHFQTSIQVYPCWQNEQIRLKYFFF